MKLQIVATNPNNLPARGSKGAAGLDLRPAGTHHILPGATELIGTGIKVAIPIDFGGLILERSSLHKLGLSLANKVGLIDPDYRGELLLSIINLTPNIVKITPDMRLAQLVLVRVPKFTLEIVDALDETDRGEGGFGSTGI